MTTLPHYLTSLEHLPLDNIFFPSELPSDKLMILLHGRGGKAEDFSWIPDFFDFDNMHYLILNAPNIYDDGYSWYDDTLESIKEVSNILSQTFDAVFKHDFDVSQSFLFGFSQGALLTFEFGARYKHTLAGYIAISGHLHNPTLLLQEIQPERKDAHWLCTHGIEDEILEFKIAKEQIERLQDHAMNITFIPYNKAHTIQSDEMQMVQHWIKSKF